jgi:DNA helicase-2/ATP-dependent DNA helicase PcrA
VGTDHPEFDLEAGRWDEARERLGSDYDGLDEDQASGVDSWAEEAISASLAGLKEQLDRGRQQPFFGRMDLGTNSGVEPIYLGFSHLDFECWSIVDWRAPVASVFYGPADENVSWKSSNGSQFGAAFLLKRRFEADGIHLGAIYDDFDRRPGAQPDIESIPPQEDVQPVNPLIRALEARSGWNMQGIVETIQEKQNEIIRAPRERTLLINGVAGSGKTAMAYHRVAYLLYPGDRDALDPRRVVVFAPNELFLKHVAKLLPAIGAPDVRQTTFDEWALQRTGLRVENADGSVEPYDVRDVALDVFLDTSSSLPERTDAWLRSRFKGTPKMHSLLQSFVLHRRSRLKLPDRPLRVTDLGPTGESIAIEPEDMRALNEELIGRELSYRGHREQLRMRLRNHAKSKMADILEGSYYGRERKRVDEAMDRLLDRLLPEIDARNAYYELLGDRDLLRQVGGDHLTEEESRRLSETPEPGEREVFREDIAAIFDLFVDLDPAPQRKFLHVVVDEAQDLSWMQLKLISKNCAGACTLLGDVAQGVNGHRGIERWEEIYDLFPDLERVDVTETYRATRPIVEYSNAILENFPRTRHTGAIPIDRDGPVPELVICNDDLAVIEAIQADLEEILASGTTNVAVITKNDVDGARLAMALGERGLPVQHFKVDDLRALEDESERVVVLTAALAKGIEFEAVLVAHVDEERYDPKVEYDGRLLYVSITRALHRLSLYSAANPSPYVIDGAASHRCEVRNFPKAA